MKSTDDNEIKKFKTEYCENEKAREEIIKNFDVEVEMFQELLPNKGIFSYASGNREIKNSFIMFKVVDKYSKKIYYPVFSESVGRQLLKKWDMPIPKKMCIFRNTNVITNTNSVKHKPTHKSDIDNKMLRLLIIFSYSLMILHIDNPKPMNQALREIYKELELHPTHTVKVHNIKSVNTAIKNFLKKSINKKHENFSSLQDYISYLEKNYKNKKIKHINFESLRKKMKEKYPTEKIVF